MFAVTTPNSALEGPRHGVGHSVSRGSRYSCSRPPTVYHCAPASRSELSQIRSSHRSFRRLPTPPICVSASPSISTPPSPIPSSSISSPSLSPQRPPLRSRSPALFQKYQKLQQILLRLRITDVLTNGRPLPRVQQPPRFDGASTSPGKPYCG
ncbi:hypothetical protein BJV74DRAFT_530685 [Russula compacta]|nr:hypothetical protein BJV74DRAFT_530685 [Russula compacta]